MERTDAGQICSHIVTVARRDGAHGALRMPADSPNRSAAQVSWWIHGASI